MVQILKDMEQLLASDPHFLLGDWLESAKAKATNSDESDLYEWNARTQISVWGPITVESVSPVCFGMGTLGSPFDI